MAAPVPLRQLSQERVTNKVEFFRSLQVCKTVPVRAFSAPAK
jgi:hypothetical protein